jgi:hypothetical protein
MKPITWLLMCFIPIKTWGISLLFTMIGLHSFYMTIHYTLSIESECCNLYEGSICSRHRIIKQIVCYSKLYVPEILWQQR